MQTCSLRRFDFINRIAQTNGRRGFACSGAECFSAGVIRFVAFICGIASGYEQSSHGADDDVTKKVATISRLFARCAPPNLLTLLRS